MNFTLNCNGKLIDTSTPLVMGVINATPDSFYDGGQYTILESAMNRIEQIVEEGCDIIDIGGMSSKPGAKIIDPQEELKRVLPIISAARIRFPNIPISIDTIHSEVAKSAIEAGANIVNDISGGEVDPKIWDVCIEHSVPYILMHMQGRPENMQDNPTYDDVVFDILNYLKTKVVQLRKRGLKDIILDPGFGFGKTIDQNYSLLKKLSVFKILECPVLIGLSRKSMIYKLLEGTPQSALNGTTAAHMIALMNGAQILRVHDVKEAVECVKIYRQVAN